MDLIILVIIFANPRGTILYSSTLLLVTISALAILTNKNTIKYKIINVVQGIN